MKLQFTITSTSESDATSRIVSDVETITIGSDPAAVVTLPGLPKAAAEIRQGDAMSLVRSDDKVALVVDEETVKQDVAVRNGTVFTIGDYDVLVTVQFERATHNVRNGFAVILTVFLIVAIIVTEGLIVKWLPERIARSELFGGEMLRQQTLYKMDNVRLTTIAGELRNKDLDQTVRSALELYKGEADRMALYLRKHSDRMTLAELKAFDADLRLLDEQARKLAKGKLIPTLKPLNLRKRLHKELKDKEAQP